MLIPSLLTANKWTQPKGPSTYEWVSGYATPWSSVDSKNRWSTDMCCNMMNLEHFQWEASHKGPHIVVPLIRNIQNRQILRIECRLVVARDWGRGELGVMAKGYRVSFWGDENFYLSAEIVMCLWTYSKILSWTF